MQKMIMTTHVLMLLHVVGKSHTYYLYHIIPSTLSGMDIVGSGSKN